jgi:hypothetical protein
MITKVTLNFAGLAIDALKLRASSPESFGLYKLPGTDIYRYGGDWLWLNPVVPSAHDEFKFWDSERGGSLQVKDNRFALTRIDPFRGAYLSTAKIAYFSIPEDIHGFLSYCSEGQTVPDAVLERLYSKLDLFVI